ncbi:MAG: hypothetical protein M1820_003161 [Bogoriella megaspora]|nr:MAG: hypothetical protein M1820_003161 [Bogoriella megaspora]
MAAIATQLLAKPTTTITKTTIDFAKAGLLEYQGLYATILDGVFSKQECDSMIAAAEQHTSGQWEQAMVNIGQGRQLLMTETRQCGRILWDSRDVVASIWSRIEDHVPELSIIFGRPHVTGQGPARRKEIWRMTRLNERMRFLKYVNGDYFKPHCDGTYETPDGKERSYYTLHLYLNDAGSQEAGEKLMGGATTFFSPRDMMQRMDVPPRVGRILIFQHRGLVHSGDDVLSGVKLTMRTDLMFEREPVDEE